MKVVELKKLNNFHVGSFSSCYGKSKVILEILICPQFKNLNFFELGFELHTVLPNSHSSTQNQLWPPEHVL
jgi:hypothetical protein